MNQSLLNRSKMGEEKIFCHKSAGRPLVSAKKEMTSKNLAAKGLFLTNQEHKNDVVKLPQPRCSWPLLALSSLSRF
jgi:hypothetical protein